jgi:membrane protein DedA with SNARE-associated domain
MEHFIATWSYLAIFGLTLISSLGIPVGSEIAIGYGGALASGALSPRLSLAAVILVAVAGELTGSAAGYAVGRFGGRALVDRVGRYVLLTHRDLDRADAWFARRGEPFVFVGRLIPLLRSFVSLAAGLGEMPLVKFALFTVAGCAVWCAALASIGYSLGSSWHRAVKDFNDVGYVAAALAVVLVVVVLVHRIRAVRAERAGAPSRGRHVAGAPHAASGPPAPGAGVAAGGSAAAHVRRIEPVRRTEGPEAPEDG